MIAYLRCLCGSNKKLAVKLAKLGYDVRPVSSNQLWRIQARSFGLKLPFVVKDGRATPVGEI